MAGGFFTPNMGQIEHSDVVFHTRNAYFTPHGVVFRVMDRDAGRMHVYRVSFQNANTVVPRSEEKLDHYSSFFYGGESSRRTHVPSYGKIVYENLWNGIDLVYTAASGGIKYEFIVHPGADISNIKLVYSGVDLRTDGQNLFIDTSAGTVVDTDLYAYQPADGTPVPVECRLVLHGNTVGYTAEYDAEEVLVIDPLIYSTFFGGSSGDWAHDMVMDQSGNIYIAGQTTSTNFPTTPGVYDSSYNGGPSDVFVMKVSSSMGLVYSTYIGGTNNDEAYGIAIDSSGNAYVTGRTGSSNYPVTTGAYDTTHGGGWCDVFVTKLNATGTGLLYSTYLGSSSFEEGFDIAVDSSGNAYITGDTTSSSFPTTSGAFDTTYNGATDGFISKLNASGASLVYSTYVGGSSTDIPESLYLFPDGNLTVAGGTASNNFPTTSGSYSPSPNGNNDLFLLKINRTGSSLVYSTYIGGSLTEYLHSITSDAAGNIYITGETHSTNFPVTSGAYCTTHNGGLDTYVLKMNSNATALMYSTYLGGSATDVGNAIAVDTFGNVYVGGTTGSSDFPATQGTYDATYNQGWDVFLCKLDPTGSSLLNSTYLGGSSDDGTDDVLVDATGLNVYITGYTDSSDFPVTSDAYDSTYNSNRDMFLSKFFLPSKPSAPENLTFSTGNRYVNLTWNAPDFNGGYNITGYVVYRGTNQSNMSQLTTLGNVTSYNDTTATNGITYWYAVAAVNPVGEGPASQPLEVQIPAFTAPGAPTDLQVKVVDGRVELTWQAPSDTGGAAVDHYNIYRGKSQDSMVLIGTTDGLTYTDSSAGSGTYYYSVSAVNSAGEGSTAAPVKVDVKESTAAQTGDMTYLLILLVLIAVVVVAYLMFRGKEAPEEEEEEEPDEEEEEEEVGVEDEEEEAAEEEDEEEAEEDEEDEED